MIRLPVKSVIRITGPVVQIRCVNILNGHSRCWHFAIHQPDPACTELGRQLRDEIRTVNPLHEFGKTRHQHADFTTVLFQRRRQSRRYIGETSSFKKRENFGTNVQNLQRKLIFTHLFYLRDMFKIVQSGKHFLSDQNNAIRTAIKPLCIQLGIFADDSSFRNAASPIDHDFLQTGSLPDLTVRQYNNLIEIAERLNAYL